MKVKELIEALTKLHEDADIVSWDDWCISGEQAKPSRVQMTECGSFNKLGNVKPVLLLKVG